MNKKDLDALNELYLSVYDGEQLNEAPVTGFRPVDRVLQGAQAFIQGNPRPTGTVNRQIQTAQQYRDAGGVGAPPPNWKPGQPTNPARSNAPAAKPTPKFADLRGSNTPGSNTPAIPKVKYPVAGTPPTKTNTPTATKTASTPSPKPSPTTPAASAPKPAVGKLGNTSFERRTPTSAELRAAQAERATQKASGQDTSSVKNAEKALQAAQKTNLPKTGPSPAIPDLKSVSADLSNANTVAKLNQQAPAGTALAKQQASNPNYKVSTAPTSAQVAGASQGIKPINNKKPPTPGSGAIMDKQSYEWPSAKTIRDIADAYSSIYEAKKVDQDQDGDTDFADVRIARLIASGMSKEEAIAKVKNKPYNEEFVTEDPVQDFRDMRRSKENAAGMRGPELSHSAKPAGSAKQKPQKPEPRSREFSHGGTTNLTGPSSPGYDTRRLGGYDLRRLANSYEFEGNIVDEGIGSAIRGLFSKKKEEEAPKPESRGAQLRKKYNVGPEKSDTSAKRQILDRSRARAEKDEKEFGGSKYSKSVAQKSKAAHDRYLKAGYSKYGADLPYAGRGKKARERAAAMTPREKKQLNREAYEAYEFVASYLLENNFAETLNDANVIIENMSDNWFESIMEDIRGASYTPNPIGNAIRAGAGLLKNTMNRPSVQGAIKTGSQMLQKSVPSGGYSTREGDGKPRETPLWDGPSKPTPTTPTKPQTKKQPPMRDEPLW
jgi:hypothetical protein